MRLHILNSSASLNRCKSSLADTDTLMLIEDAVVLSSSIFSDVDTTITIYALADDLQRRGIKAPSNIEALNYPQFVDLCVAHTQCLSW